jgi:hypothetical protein
MQLHLFNLTFLKGEKLTMKVTIRKNRLAVTIAALAASGLALASTNSDAKMMAELQAMNQNMQQLQSQVGQLQGQVNTLKTKLKIHTVKAKAVAQSLRAQNKQAPRHFSYFPKGSSVVIAPFTSTPTYSNGHQLIVNAPSILEDEKLLTRSKQAKAEMKERGIKPAYPTLVFSGSLEGVAQYINPYRGHGTSDIDLGTAQLDSFISFSPWVSGFMAMKYDSATNTTSANRVDNSRFYLDKGFITIGNLAKSPFYGSIGQFYVPFGRYSSGMIDLPLTTFIGKSKARAIMFGFKPDGSNRPYAEIFGFKGASKSNGNRVDDFGADAGYDFSVHNVNGEVGVSAINTIADGKGFQSNGRSSGFQGFNSSSTAEDLKHNVPGVDVHGSVNLGSFGLIGEYVTATRRFDSTDLTFKTHGARPSAFNLEGSYSLYAFSHPSSVGLEYGFSREALGLNLPRTRLGAYAEMAIQKYTILTLEYRHDINYGKRDTATGNTLTAYTASDLGRSSNAVIAQLGVYF